MAVGNLANRYLDAGFVEEASQTLQKVKQQEEVHASVGNAMAAISKNQEQESQKETETLLSAREQQQFFSKFADAYFSGTSETPLFAGKWLWRHNAVAESEGYIEVTITQDLDVIEAKWMDKSLGYTLKGKVQNRGATINSYEIAGYDIKMADHGYMYLSVDYGQLALITFKDSSHSFMTFVRIED